jgi:hypothetical protein
MSDDGAGGRSQGSYGCTRSSRRTSSPSPLPCHVAVQLSVEEPHLVANNIIMMQFMYYVYHGIRGTYRALIAQNCGDVVELELLELQL